MNYRTYAEAKIANPDSEIVTTGKNWSGHYSDQKVGTFEKQGCHIISENAWVICNPADHCSSLKEFLEAGFKLVEGDKFIDVNANVISVENYNASNVINDSDANRYILSAAALNSSCKIPDKVEQWTVYNNTMPLCELSDEQVGKLVKHSGCVEHMNPNSGDWAATITPMWNRAGVYRIKPKSERDLFIDAAINHGIKPETQNPKQIFGELFDSGKFKYIDNTQHFGENI